MTIAQITQPSKTDRPLVSTVHAPACPAPDVSPDDQTEARTSPEASRPLVPHRGPRPEHYQRIWLDGTETTAELRVRGVPARTARTAVKRGWYTQHYHHLQYPQDEGPGLFATLTNPYAFATAQVRHVLRAHVWGEVTPEDLEDAVQDALLWAWERRHCAHIADFPAYISTVIREKLRKRPRQRA
jgi:hypothetical protein